MSNKSHLDELKLRTLDLVSNGIAHDLNNILSIIEGHCEILQAEYPAFAGAEHLEKISDSVLQGGALAKQLLAMSNQMPYQVKSVPAKQVVNAALSLIHNSLGSSTAAHAVISSDLFIQVDANTCAQIIVNVAADLVSNLPDGNNDITLELGEADNRQKVTLSITAEVTRHLEFTNMPYADLVADMGAKIEQVHNGVNIHIPVCPKTHVVELSLPEEESVGDINTMLLVEDDEHLANIYQMLMLDAGFVVTHAKNGVEGCEFYQNEGPFDVVLTDEQMPLRKGSEMARMIHKDNPEQLIVLLSGFEDENIKSCLDEGIVNTTLTKPVRLMDLLNTIKAHMASTS